jgi:hypothetical protein
MLLSLPCGNGGKPTPIHPSLIPFFQFSSFAQRSFRKPYPSPTRSLQAISPDFPLFLSQLRVLLSFFFISLPFSSHPSLRTPSFAKLPLLCQPKIQIPLITLRIQRTTPFFHLHENLRVNTIKKYKRLQFPYASYMLYSVASADSASIRFSLRVVKRGCVHAESRN